MAKEKNGSKWKTAIWVAGVIFTIGVGWGTLGFAVNGNAKGMSTLKSEGCLPARENKNVLVRVETELKGLRTQQSADTKLLLEAINKK